MRRLLIATTNKGKVREMKDAFSDLNVEVVGLDEYPELEEVEEDGDSFAENALKKARCRAGATGELTVADDSGLEVEYLDGRPGIYSSRYAGENATDEQNNKKLLQELKDVPADRRKARFKTIAAVVDPETSEEFTVEGICEGLITSEPRGKNGFGYDPLFYIPVLNKTMAELNLSEKNKISHRARAVEKLKKLIIDRYLKE